MIVEGFLVQFLFLILTSMIGIAVAVILFFSHHEKSFGNRFLALSVFSISYMLLVNASFLTNFYYHYPATYRALSFLSFCIGPFSYLYVRTLIRQEYQLSKTDWLFFIPALIALINRIPYYLLSPNQQIQLLDTIKYNLKLIVMEPEGLLPPGYLALFRIVFTLAFIIAQLQLIQKWKKKMIENDIYIPSNNEIIKWLELFTFCLLISSSLLFIQTFLQVSSSFHFEWIIIFTMGLTNLFACVMLLARPRILYGLVGWMQTEKPVISLKDVPASKFNEQATTENNGSSLSIEEGNTYRKMLEEHFKASKTFLNPGYTINDLSKELKIPIYQLSSFINQEFQKSFVQYINDQRFRYLLNMIKEDPAFKNYTIDYIGKKIGFNSRTSFIEFIKKRTGKTPSEFFKEA